MSIQSPSSHPFTTLPEDTFVNIFSNLTVNDLGKFASVCCQFFQLLEKNNAIWREKTLVKRYPWSGSEHDLDTLLGLSFRQQIKDDVVCFPDRKMEIHTSQRRISDRGLRIKILEAHSLEKAIDNIKFAFTYLPNDCFGRFSCAQEDKEISIYYENNKIVVVSYDSIQFDLNVKTLSAIERIKRCIGLDLPSSLAL